MSPLLLIPITLRYLGPERYGVWMAVTSVTSMLLWADLGLGNGLLTRLSPLVVREAWDEGRQAVSTAYGILAVVGLSAAALSLASSWFVPWRAVFNSGPGSDTSQIATVCLVAFAINIPLALVHRLLFALQRVSASNGLQLLGAALSLSSAVIAVKLSAPDTLLVALIVAGPVVANVLGTVILFSRVVHLRPRLLISRVESRGLISSGLRFMAVAVLTSLALNADYLIVAHVASIEDVAGFSIVARLFMALGLLVTVVNLPLWPANAEALARGDTDWVRRTTHRMMLLSGVAVAVAGAALLAVSSPLFNALGVERVAQSLPLMLGFAALWTSFAVASPLFMVQNSVGILGPQLLGWGLFLAISVPARIVVSTSLGIEWIPATSAVLYLLIVIPCASNGYRRAYGTEPGA